MAILQRPAMFGTPGQVMKIWQVWWVCGKSHLASRVSLDDLSIIKNHFPLNTDLRRNAKTCQVWNARPGYENLAGLVGARQIPSGMSGFAGCFIDY
jgi:hypothetical protein